MCIPNVVARNIIDATDLIHLSLYCWCIHLLHNSLISLKTGQFYIRVSHCIHWRRWETIMCLSRKWHWSRDRITMCMFTCMPVCIYPGMFGSMCVGNSNRNGITILLRACSKILFCMICDTGFGLCITWAHLTGFNYIFIGLETISDKNISITDNPPLYPNQIYMQYLEVTFKDLCTFIVM